MNKILGWISSFALLANFAVAQVVHYSSGFQRPQTTVSGVTNIWKDAKVDNQGNACVLALLSVNQVFNSQTYTVTTTPVNRLGKMLIKYNAAGAVQ